MPDVGVATAAADRARGVKYDEGWYDDEYFRERYGRMRNFYYAVAATLGEHLPNVRTALDAGCGVGLVVEAWTAMGIDAYGFDVAPAAVSQALPHVRDRLIVCNTSKEKLPYPDGKFDLVTTIEVVEHLPEHDAFVSELARVTRPGGWLFVQTPKPNTDAAIHDPTHISVKHKRDWLPIFERHGYVQRDDVFAQIEGHLPIGSLGRKIGFLRDLPFAKRYLVRTGTRTIYQKKP